MTDADIIARAQQLKDQAATLEAMLWFCRGPCAERFAAIDRAARQSYMNACAYAADGCGRLADDIRRLLDDQAA